MRASYGALEQLIRPMNQFNFKDTALLTMLPETASGKNLQQRLEHTLYNEQTIGRCKVSLKYVNDCSCNCVLYGNTLDGSEIVDWLMEKIKDNKRLSAFSLVVCPISDSHEIARVYFFVAV